MNKKSITPLIIIFISFLFTSISQAQTDMLSGNLSDEIINENAVIETITPDTEFAVVAAAKDPFKPLVIKKVITYKKPIKHKKKSTITKPLTKIIQPLKLKITGICGNSDKRQVVLQYKNKEYTLDTGEKVKNKFKVMNINDNKITVYSISESRRRTFKL